MLQILLCLFPSLFLYRVICQQSYFGTLNLISVFIVVGVGVDDIFVFHDDWLLQKVNQLTSLPTCTASATRSAPGTATASPFP